MTVMPVITLLKYTSEAESLIAHYMCLLHTLATYACYMRSLHNHKCFKYLLGNNVKSDVK